MKAHHALQKLEADFRLERHMDKRDSIEIKKEKDFCKK